MPYTAPLGNVANFNFRTSGYSAPLGNAANFNFSAVADATGQRSRLGVIYAVDALVDVGRARLGVIYKVDAQKGQRQRLGVVWSTTESLFQRSRLGVVYDVHVTDNKPMRLGVAYATATFEASAANLWVFWTLNMDVARSLILPTVNELALPFVIDAGMSSDVARSLILDSMMGGVARSIDLPSPLYQDVARSIALDSTMRAEVGRSFDLTSDLLNQNTIARELQLPSPLLNSAEVIETTEAYAVIDGTTVPLQDVEVSTDEGTLGWTSRMILARVEDYDLFTAESYFDIVLGGETYTFLFDGKQKPRGSITDKSANVSGVSPAMVYSEPRAQKITKTWTTPIRASELAEELFPGESIDWTIIDWAIPSPRLAASNETPVAIMRRVLSAAGALLEADNVGALYVRYRYPVSVPSYPTAAPDQVFTDADHNFSSDEGIQLATLTNRIRIMDVATAGFQDRIEFEPDKTDPTQGILKVWPSPWRETFNVEHTSLPIVSVAKIGVQTEELEETVEVIAGKGRLNRPVFTIDDFEFLYADLGGIVVDLDASDFTTTINGESLVKINYTTRYVAYRAVAYRGAQVQFVVREPDNA